MHVIAHRGACAQAPENSFAAYERALEIGVDGLEVDIQLTRDGKLVIRHDDLILLNGDWRYIRELTFDELQTIDLGNGERMPSVELFLDRFHNRCPLVLDIKAFGCAALLERVLGGRKQGLHVTSFLHQEIEMLGKRCPEVERAITVTAIPVRFEDLLHASNVRAIAVFRGFLTEALARRLVGQGIALRAYSVNLLSEARRFADWGVEAVYTDDPLALQSLRSGGQA